MVDLYKFNLSELKRKNIVKHHTESNNVFAIIVKDDIEHSVFNLVLRIDFDGKIML